MQKTSKKQYTAPTLKVHGVVRELTQSGSGGRQKDKFKKNKNKNKNH